MYSRGNDSNKVTNIEKIKAIKPNLTKKLKTSLEEKLNQIKLTPTEEISLRNKNAANILNDKILGVFPFLLLSNTLFNWNKQVNEEISEFKKECLFSLYLDKTEENEERLNLLINLVTDPIGNTLFNKVLQISDDSPPDAEQINYLANALVHIVKTDFKNLFDKHNYALSQIAILSPQALAILVDHENWPLFDFGGDTGIDEVSSVGLIYDDWTYEFTKLYCISKSIDDQSLRERVKNSVNQLKLNGHIEGREVNNRGRCCLTNLGRELVEYLSS